MNRFVHCSCGLQISKAQGAVILMDGPRTVSHSRLWIVLDEGEVKVVSLLSTRDFSKFFQEKW